MAKDKKPGGKHAVQAAKDFRAAARRQRQKKRAAQAADAAAKAKNSDG